MDITDEMLKVAITKSVEAGLLPRRALKEDFHDAKEIMRTILQCVFEKTEASLNSQICIDSDTFDSSSALKKSSYLPV